MPTHRFYVLYREGLAVGRLLAGHRENRAIVIGHIRSSRWCRTDMRPPQLSAEAETTLAAYDFPGNVRELKNLLDRALIESGGGTIGSDHLRFVYAREEGGLAQSDRHDSPGSPGSTAPHQGAYPEGSDEAKVLVWIRERGSINNSECRDLLQVGIQRACYLLRKLHRAGLVVRDHSRKSAHYRLAP